MFHCICFLAFLMSGLFAGIAGALYMLFNNFVSPSTVELSQSVSGLLMAVTGGVGTLFGSFVGAAAIIVLENVVSTFTARWPTILGSYLRSHYDFRAGGPCRPCTYSVRSSGSRRSLEG